ncbi:putative RNA pseudouridine synthase [bioreactor metagenome]|uniref:Putative RNA pseudouridine synthase n=1 Tax=bioreactor metagenome TaxID=1076179 RepID=A0A645HJA5_9ZZZZ
MAAFPIGTPGTKEAVTHYRVLRAYGAFSYVELTLETGRTHQIRVHMREIGHPVLADPVYAAGRKTLGLYGQALVAFHIGFIHPVTGERLVFECPDPDFINKALEIIEHEI